MFGPLYKSKKLIMENFAALTNKLKNKNTLVIILIAAIFSLAAAFGFLINSKQPTKEKQVVHSVALNADRAVPDILSIKLGEIVVFNSRDGQSHNIAQGKGNDFKRAHDHPEGSIESGRFAADEGYRVELKKTGTYNFHDHLNPNIYVTIVVY